MPERADAVVVGGGVIGSSIALHLRERRPDWRVLVLERDPTYARASSRLATGGVRQQYESPLNVAMARHSVAFYARMDDRLEAVGHPGRVWFRQRGYLFLATDANGGTLEARYAALRRGGAAVERWKPDEVRARVPGLACEDVRFALFGPEDGYLDPRAVLAGMRALAEAAGAEFRSADLCGVERRQGRVCGVAADEGTGRILDVRTEVVIDAAGAYAARVADIAGLSLPIVPVRQHLFRLELEAPLPTRIPMIFDPDGTHWRLDDARDGARGDRLVVGRSRPDEPPGETFTCDHRRLEEEMRPTLARRYPAARIGSVAEAWAGLYEMTPDHNALLGEHPALPGFIVAAGFSGHGLMMAPATGLAVAELVAGAGSRTFDVAQLAPDRFERGQLFHDGALI